MVKIQGDLWKLESTSTEEEENVQAVVTLTCQGDYYDPAFSNDLETLVQSLSTFLDQDDTMNIQKVEPWNSVRVTISIPKEAAEKLQSIAQANPEVLKQLGILTVQVEGGKVISLTMAQNTEIPQTTLNSSSQNSNGVQPQPQQPPAATTTIQKPSKVQQQPSAFRSPNVVAPQSDPIPVLPPKPTQSPRPYPFTSMNYASSRLDSTIFVPTLNNSTVKKSNNLQKSMSVPMSSSTHNNFYGPSSSSTNLVRRPYNRTVSAAAGAPPPPPKSMLVNLLQKDKPNVKKRRPVDDTTTSKFLNPPEDLPSNKPPPPTFLTPMDPPKMSVASKTSRSRFDPNPTYLSKLSGKPRLLLNPLTGHLENEDEEDKSFHRGKPEAALRMAKVSDLDEEREKIKLKLKVEKEVVKLVDEPRVPPLHISLRGKSATVVEFPTTRREGEEEVDKLKKKKVDKGLLPRLKSGSWSGAVADSLAEKVKSRRKSCVSIVHESDLNLNVKESEQIGQEERSEVSKDQAEKLMSIIESKEDPVSNVPPMAEPLPKLIIVEKDEPKKKHSHEPKEHEIPLPVAELSESMASSEKISTEVNILESKSMEEQQVSPIKEPIPKQIDVSLIQEKLRRIGTVQIEVHQDNNGQLSKTDSGGSVFENLEEEGQLSQFKEETMVIVETMQEHPVRVQSTDQVEKVKVPVTLEKEEDMSLLIGPLTQGLQDQLDKDADAVEETKEREQESETVEEIETGTDTSQVDDQIDIDKSEAIQLYSTDKDHQHLECRNIEITEVTGLTKAIEPTKEEEPTEATAKENESETKSIDVLDQVTTVVEQIEILKDIAVDPIEISQSDENIESTPQNKTPDEKQESVEVETTQLQTPSNQHETVLESDNVQIPPEEPQEVVEIETQQLVPTEPEPQPKSDESTKPLKEEPNKNFRPIPDLNPIPPILPINRNLVKPRMLIPELKAIIDPTSTTESPPVATMATENPSSTNPRFPIYQIKPGHKVVPLKLLTIPNSSNFQSILVPVSSMRSPASARSPLVVVSGRSTNVLSVPNTSTTPTPEVIHEVTKINIGKVLDVSASSNMGTESSSIGCHVEEDNVSREQLENPYDFESEQDQETEPLTSPRLAHIISPVDKEPNESDSPTLIRATSPIYTYSNRRNVGGPRSPSPDCDDQEIMDHLKTNLSIEIPEPIRSTRSNTRIVSPDITAFRSSPKPKIKSPTSSSPSSCLSSPSVVKKNNKKRQASSGSDNLEENESTSSSSSRPNKRKCSENAAGLIKAFMIEENNSKKPPVLKKVEDVKVKSCSNKRMAPVLEEHEEIQSRSSSEDRSSSRGSSSSKSKGDEKEKPTTSTSRTNRNPVSTSRKTESVPMKKIAMRQVKKISSKDLRSGGSEGPKRKTRSSAVLTSPSSKRRRISKDAKS